jgi:hypothetical protein
MLLNSITFKLYFEKILEIYIEFKKSVDLKSHQKRLFTKTITFKNLKSLKIDLQKRLF